MFPSRNTANGKVGMDAQWAFAAPTCEILSKPSEPPVQLPTRWYMLEFSLDGGAEWKSHQACNVGDKPNPEHTYVFFLTGQGNKLGVRLADKPTNDNYGRLRVVVIALHIDGGAGVEPGS